MIYQSQAPGGIIGSILRLVQEEKAAQPTNLPPSADVNAPIREMTQEPLKGPESPGTNRVVSIRPESVTGMEAPSSLPTSAVPARSTVGPVSIGGPGGTNGMGVSSTGVLVQRAAPLGMEPNQMPPLTSQQPSAPAAPGAPQTMGRTVLNPAPALGTKIMPSAPYVAPVKQTNFNGATDPGLASFNATVQGANQAINKANQIQGQVQGVAKSISNVSVPQNLATLNAQLKQNMANYPKPTSTPAPAPKTTQYPPGWLGLQNLATKIFSLFGR